MNNFIIGVLIFILGLGILICNGCNGYFSSSNIFSYLGMLICMIGIFFPFVLLIIKKLRK